VRKEHVVKAFFIILVIVVLPSVGGFFIGGMLDVGEISTDQVGFYVVVIVYFIVISLLLINPMKTDIP
jgi:hypothetical protein